MSDRIVLLDGLDPARVLIALFDAASARGRGPAALMRLVCERSGFEFSLVDARGVLADAADGHVDYVNGRPLKLQFFRGDDGAFVSVFVALYERDHGEGSALEVIERMRRQS